MRVRRLNYYFLRRTFVYYNGLSVCATRERVNRYTVNFSNMLTLTVTYGKMFLDRKAAVGVWPAAEVKNEARLGEGK